MRVTSFLIFSCTSVYSSTFGCASLVFGCWGACFEYIFAFELVRSSFICPCIWFLSAFTRRFVASYSFLPYCMTGCPLWPSSSILCYPENSDSQDTWPRGCEGSWHSGDLDLASCSPRPFLSAHINCIGDERNSICRLPRSCSWCGYAKISVIWGCTAPVYVVCGPITLWLVFFRLLMWRLSLFMEPCSDWWTALQRWWSVICLHFWARSKLLRWLDLDPLDQCYVWMYIHKDKGCY